MKKKIIRRPGHDFARECVDPNAVKVLEKLGSKGFDAYLVGGSVRDILLKLAPKDFDIATDARPEEVRKVFKNSRLIGRRFRLAHVYFDRRNVIEVATFRSTAQAETTSKDGMIIRDNVYGGLDDDARRRDFTVNSLYYDWLTDTVIDFHHGLDDIRTKQIRFIGDPQIRYREDPVRILRALRFAAKLKFTVTKEVLDPIPRLSPLLSRVSPARIYEEFVKTFQSGGARQTLDILIEHDLLKYFIPAAARSLAADADGSFYRFIATALADTDKRVAENMRITPAYLVAVFLWDVVQKKFAGCMQGPEPVNCMQKSASETLTEQKEAMIIPKVMRYMARNIWDMQSKFHKTKGEKAFRLLAQKKFRAGFDFLYLRSRTNDENLTELVTWWDEFQKTSTQKRRKMAGFG